MYALGHLGLALLVFAPVALYLRATGRVGLAAGGAVASATLSTAPDVDLLLASVPHRGITHTVWFATGVGLFLGTFLAVHTVRGGRRTPLRQFGWAALVGCLTTTSHLLGDLLTPMGIEPFAPVWDLHLTLNLVAASNPTANRTLFTLGLLATTMVWTTGLWMPVLAPGRSRRRNTSGDVGARAETEP
ncbi:metal-dependent hydrolase [Haloarchaeobius sp. TZWWS8]|uniref:metal-dependent hydrolase n=1 Tax=Haloarchaeobius sp. TZWWS8 TaxID=3446121 RepID=UPI003EBC8ED3